MKPSDLQQAVLSVAANLARKVFAGDPAIEEKVADTVSRAWELSRTASAAATPGTVAVYAIRQIRIRRQFRESQRSIDGPNPRRVAKPQREGFDLYDLVGRSADPADIVQVRLDTETWWLGLSDRERAIAEALAMNGTPTELAKQFGCTAGRISQIRRVLWERWEALQV